MSCFGRDIWTCRQERGDRPAGRGSGNAYYSPIYIATFLQEFGRQVLVRSSMCCSSQPFDHRPRTPTVVVVVRRTTGGHRAQDSSKFLGSLTTQLRGGWGRAGGRAGRHSRKALDIAVKAIRLCRERHQSPTARPPWGGCIPMPSSCRRRRKKQQQYGPLPWGHLSSLFKTSRKMTRC